MSRLHLFVRSCAAARHQHALARRGAGRQRDDVQHRALFDGERYLIDDFQL